MFLKRIKTSRGTQGHFIMRKEDIETLCKVTKHCKVRGNIGIFKNSTGYCEAFSVGETVAIYSGKILEGVYPNYKQVIPRELENIVSINRDVLEKAVKSIKQFTPKPERGNLGISFRQHGRMFCAENFNGEVITELAPSEKELPAIDFQLLFFEEAIKNSKGAFKLAFAKSFSPALLKTETEFFILMPLHKAETNRTPAEPEKQIENNQETVNA
jgi:DNA polymerase III sliding clamp (beta) subunit (PCNA family)